MPATLPKHVLDELAAMGLHLAIDDFGTGYSSLSYLKKFAIDVVKLDRTFIEGLVTDPVDAEIASAVIRLSAALDISTVAEGVETESQRQMLVQLGCPLIQGYLMARPLAAPFFVIATQNPIEQDGTFPLPEAQLDRFAMRVAIGYPTLADEARMLSEQTSGSPLESLVPVTNGREVLALVAEAQAIFVEESVNRYVVALLRHTRADSRLYLGGSPRAGISLVRVAKARALAHGRDYLAPDDVKSIAEAVLSHRLIVAPEARAAGTTSVDLVRDALDKTPVPV